MLAPYCLERPIYGVLICLCLLAPAWAADDEPQQPNFGAAGTTSPGSIEVKGQREERQRPAHLVVLRLSSTMLAAQIDCDIDRQRAVSDNYKGTPISGMARVVGKLRVRPVPSADSACFEVRFSGTVNSRTTGRNGSVVVHGRSITQFSGSKEIVFEPGNGFYGRPTKLSVNTQYDVEGIDPGRGGLIGRIIERRAAEQVAADRAQMAAHARQRASERISARFEEYVTEKLARLNKAVEFQTRLAQLRQGDGIRKLYAHTTAEYLEIADAIIQDSTPAPLLLPTITRTGNPVEIWIHHTLVSEKIGQALKTIFTSPDQNTVVTALAALPGPFGKESAAAITALLAGQKVNIQTAGDWTVVELTPPAATILASSRPTSRR